MSARVLIRMLAAATGVLLPRVTASAPIVTEKWVVRYVGPTVGSDAGLAITRSTDGSIVVTGRSLGTVTPLDYDFATIRYSPAGTELWAKRYNGAGTNDDDASAIATDAGGNVYVTGWSAQSSSGISEYDFATICYDANGDTSWIRRHDGLPGLSPGSDDFPMALAVSVDGYVYATGRSKELDPYPQLATVKYEAATGNSVWVKYQNGSGAGQDAAFDLAIDGSGDVFVAGYVQNSGRGRDVAVIKYSPSGDTLWVRYYDGPTSGSDEATAIELDAAGHVYVTGNSADPGGSRDFITIKFSATGDTAWTRRYDGPASEYDVATALAVDAEGNVLVTGRSNDVGPNPDYATIRYLPNGDLSWVRRHNGPGNYTDIPQAIAVDVEGSIYVTGGSTGLGGHLDYFTIKYLPTGDTAWTQRYDGPGAGSDDALAMTVDECGCVYITGESRGVGPANDMVTIKYLQLDSDGDEIADLCDLCQALATPGNVAIATGDVNLSGSITSADVIGLVNYVFKGGPAPQPVPQAGDADCSHSVNSSDVIKLVNFVFKSGLAPCDVCAL